jgi:hypothetical protein
VGRSSAVGVGLDPAEVTALHDLVREVLGALAELPARQRQALVLQSLEGASLEDIAEHVGGDDGSAKALVFRARAGLRARLADRSIGCDEVRTLVAAAARRGVRAPHGVHRHLSGATSVRATTRTCVVARRPPPCWSSR